MDLADLSGTRACRHAADGRAPADVGPRRPVGGKDTRGPRPCQDCGLRTRVEPILPSRCLKCHGEERKVKGDLRLDSREAILRGGDQAGRGA